jgi:hypothetical protein
MPKLLVDVALYGLHNKICDFYRCMFPYHLFCKRKLKFHFNMQQERDLMMIIKSQRAKL